MQIQISLWTDYLEILKNDLAASGFALAGNESEEDIFISYGNWDIRRVRPRKRTVSLSKQFSCPSDLAVGLKAVKEKLERGENVNPHLSRNLKKLDYNDLMLNDWGIHHFHLGTVLESDGFAKRTGPVLFAIVREDATYFIGVFSHGSWARKDLVQVVHENWPELIARYKITRVTPKDQIGDAEIKAARAKHVNTLLQMDDGSVYAPVGGGFMSDGTAMSVMLRMDSTRMRFAKAEELIRQSVAATDAAKGMGSLTFTLLVDDDGGRAVEPTTGLVYTLWKAAE
jgi:hypothetical protein